MSASPRIIFQELVSPLAVGTLVLEIQHKSSKSKVIPHNGIKWFKTWFDHIHSNLICPGLISVYIYIYIYYV